MRPDQLHGYHAAHETDRLPAWAPWAAAFCGGLLCLEAAYFMGLFL
jgi:hypothetical protein